MLDDEDRREKKKRKRSRKSKKKEGSRHDDEVADDNDNTTDITTEEKPPSRGKEEPKETIEPEEKPKRKRKRKRKSKTVAIETGTPLAASIDDQNTSKLTSLDLTVYVEGIPFDCTEEQVKDFFVSNGCEDILQLRLPRWQDSGRLRGYGHVVFDSTESKAKAIAELSGKNLGPRYLTIQTPKAPRADTTMGAIQSRSARDQPEGCKTVYVKNLPWEATEEDIRESFQVCGKILEGGVRIARNYTTRESKGFAYVEFKNPEGAHGAVKKAAKPFGMTVKGRPCFVDYDEGRMKGSFKTKDGRLWSRQYHD